MSPAIEVSQLGKCFLRNLRPRSASLRETLLTGWRRDGQSAPAEPHWALRDVSFSAELGQVTGILGQNGSGKSSLLKILARVLTPTEGEARIAGRLCSLLELGTGFHPELSGRDNVFLYGAMLGMPRREVQRKFDAIVCFAAAEKALDSPVRTYSSGMHVRLGFAVAAHLDPDILLVDEALAVGDAAFRQKALAHIREIARKGACVLLVSHDYAQIDALCDRGIVLSEGRMVYDGGVQNALDIVQRGSQAEADGPAVLEGADLSWEPESSETPLRVAMRWKLSRDMRACQLAVVIRDPYERRLASAWIATGDLAMGTHALIARIDGVHFNPGEYRLELALADAAGGISRRPNVARLQVPPAVLDDRPEMAQSEPENLRLRLVLETA